MLLILNSVLPVFVIIAMGSVLRRMQFTTERFHRVSDKLVYFIFFPVLLFWKIGSPATAEALHWRLNLAVLTAVFIVYLSGILYARLAGLPDRAVGSFSQAGYRFNTYIGLAIILNVLGEEGVRYFGTLISFAIPFINVLAVWTLIWYSGVSYSSSEKARFIVKSMLSNPLILACLAGIFYAELVEYPFPVFLNNTFKLLAPVTLPLALLSIGSSLSFEKFKGFLGTAVVSCVLKLSALPVVGLFCLHQFGVAGTPFKVGMIFFALPTSTAIYILSSQFNSDTDLASASIVLSTLLSFASLSVTLVLLAD